MIPVWVFFMRNHAWHEERVHSVMSLVYEYLHTRRKLLSWRLPLSNVATATFPRTRLQFICQITKYVIVDSFWLVVIPKSLLLKVLHKDSKHLLKTIQKGHFLSQVVFCHSDGASFHVFFSTCSQNRSREIIRSRKSKGPKIKTPTIFSNFPVVLSSLSSIYSTALEHSTAFTRDDDWLPLSSNILDSRLFNWVDHCAIA